ncbi:MAG: GrpB family protein [Bacteroidia bacterium]|nr:GrpB family protein [Bacteroidia bacterium]
MVRKVEELTREELGKLFPVEIVSYNPGWPILFEEEKELLINTLGHQVALRTEHFGSTAVPGLAAKPTIDILVEIPPLNEQLKGRIIENMDSIDYNFIWRTDDPVPYMMFVKGYTLEGIKGQAFHIHMGQRDHSLWDRLFFRDFLRQDPAVARQYEKLKYELAKKYRFDRDGYTIAKTGFITAITGRAKNLLITGSDPELREERD